MERFSKCCKAFFLLSIFNVGLNTSNGDVPTKSNCYRSAQVSNTWDSQFIPASIGMGNLPANMLILLRTLLGPFFTLLDYIPCPAPGSNTPAFIDSFLRLSLEYRSVP